MILCNHSKAILEVSFPRDVTKLRYFLGLVNNYCNFLLDLAMTFPSLYGLQEKEKCMCI